MPPAVHIASDQSIALAGLSARAKFATVASPVNRVSAVGINNTTAANPQHTKKTNLRAVNRGQQINAPGIIAAIMIVPGCHKNKNVTAITSARPALHPGARNQTPRNTSAETGTINVIASEAPIVP